MKNLLAALLMALATFQSAISEERIKTAAFMPLSGSWSPNGYYTKEGIELAQASLKKEGINLDVKFEDVCLANDVVTALKSLALNSSIEGIVANYWRTRSSCYGECNKKGENYYISQLNCSRLSNRQ